VPLIVKIVEVKVECNAGGCWQRSSENMFFSATCSAGGKQFSRYRDLTQMQNTATIISIQ
jgi:hypothetical protein